METFKEKLGVAINCMLQDDARGEVIGFKRESGSLVPRPVNDIESIFSRFEEYEMLLFDGGNPHGDSWKYVFFPKTGVFCFVDEIEKQKRKFK